LSAFFCAFFCTVAYKNQSEPNCYQPLKMPVESQAEILGKSWNLRGFKDWKASGVLLMKYLHFCEV